MYGGVATGTPAGAITEIGRVVFFSDENLPRCPLHLCVTFQAKIVVAFNEHLGVDRTVWAVTHRATFAQGFVLEDERLRLVAVTVRAGLVQARQTRAAGGLHDIRAVRVVALHAVHFAFEHRMMLRQAEFGVGVEVTIETGGGVPARIQNKFPTPATDFNVFAPGTVAGFTTAGAGCRHRRKVHPGMGAGGELLDVIGVALQAGFVADVIRTRDVRRHDDRPRNR